MKKFVIFIFALALLINSVFALTTDLKESYNQKESVLVKITGNVLQPINKNQVEFRRGHVAVPLDFDVKKIEDNNYLWFNTPESAENYTLVLKKVVTTVSGAVKEIDFEQNFSVGINKSEYTIWSAIVYTREDFSVKVSLNVDENKVIKVNFPTPREETLKPGDNFIQFKIKDFVNLNTTYLKIGDYSVITFVYGNGSTIIQNSSTKIDRLRFKPRTIQSITIANNQTKSYPFQIINGEYMDYNIELNYNKDLFDIEPENYFTIKAGDFLMFNLTLKKIPQEGINEVITANVGKESFDMFIAINFTDNTSEAITPYLNESYNESYGMRCVELGGRVCLKSEVCTNKTVNTYEGTCCLALCKDTSSGSDYSWIGYVLGGVGIILLLYILVKYKKTRPGEKTIRDKFALAEKRMP